jgi:hypothetical protein
MVWEVVMEIGNMNDVDEIEYKMIHVGRIKGFDEWDEEDFKND